MLLQSVYMRLGITNRGWVIAYPSKIATCCHCGTRALLRLGKGHHSLSCSACGAPLRVLKAFPVADTALRSAVTHQPKTQKARKRPKIETAKYKVYKKKRKSLFRKFAEEAFDFVEDIFD